jgi:hypothetical protein
LLRVHAAFYSARSKRRGKFGACDSARENIPFLRRFDASAGGAQEGSRAVKVS